MPKVLISDSGKVKVAANSNQLADKNCCCGCTCLPGGRLPREMPASLTFTTEISGQYCEHGAVGTCDELDPPTVTTGTNADGATVYLIPSGSQPYQDGAHYYDPYYGGPDDPQAQMGWVCAYGPPLNEDDFVGWNIAVNGSGEDAGVVPTGKWCIFGAPGAGRCGGPIHYNPYERGYEISVPWALWYGAVDDQSGNDSRTGWYLYWKTGPADGDDPDVVSGWQLKFLGTDSPNGGATGTVTPLSYIASPGKCRFSGDSGCDDCVGTTFSYVLAVSDNGTPWDPDTCKRGACCQGDNSCDDTALEADCSGTFFPSDGTGIYGRRNGDCNQCSCPSVTAHWDFTYHYQVTISGHTCTVEGSSEGDTVCTPGPSDRGFVDGISRTIPNFACNPRISGEKYRFLATVPDGDITWSGECDDPMHVTSSPHQAFFGTGVGAIIFWDCDAGWSVELALYLPNGPTTCFSGPQDGGSGDLPSTVSGYCEFGTDPDTNGGHLDWSVSFTSP